jgi:hypothetical protein
MRSNLLIHSIVLCAALGAQAHAADYFVNAATGNNADSGVTRQFAWRTLTHAVATVPAGTALVPNVIHVAAGTYGVQTSEVFPLAPRDFVHIVGYGGQRATIIDGRQTGAALFRLTLAPGASAGRDCLIEGLTLRNAAHAVHATSTDGALRFTLRDARVVRMSFAGVFADARFGQSGSGVTIGGVEPTIQRSEITLSGTAITVSSLGFATLVVEDSAITDNFGEGIAFGANMVSHMRCERTRFYANAGVGAFAGGPTQGSGSTTVLRDCAFVANSGGGASLRSIDPSFHQHTLVVERSTFAFNSVAGLDLANAFGGDARPATLVDSIFWGNTDDLRETPSAPSGVTAVRCDIGDGDFTGVNGTFAADPLFRDPSLGDVRLLFGSPCIDIGDPSLAPGVRDVDGVARAIDGDLDTLERSDLGAHEFQLLSARGPARLGQDLVLEIAGPAGAQAVLLAKIGALAPQPQLTPYGEFDLAAGFVRIGVVTAMPSPPALRVIGISDQPSLLGQTFTLQMLVPSAAAPNGKAYSNALSLVISP